MTQQDQETEKLKDDGMGYYLTGVWVKADKPGQNWHWFNRGDAKPARCGYTKTEGCYLRNVKYPDTKLCPDCQYFYQKGIRRQKMYDKIAQFLLRMLVLLFLPGLVLYSIFLDTKNDIKQPAELLFMMFLLVLSHTLAWLKVFVLTDPD